MGGVDCHAAGLSTCQSGGDADVALTGVHLPSCPVSSRGEENEWEAGAMDYEMEKGVGAKCRHRQAVRVDGQRSDCQGGRREGVIWPKTTRMECRRAPEACLRQE